MSIASLTLAWFRIDAPAPVPRASSTGEAPRPVAAPAPAPAAACACPSPRGGLADAVQSAAGADDAQARPELRGAVIDFARALMQALRAEGEGSRRHGHHHHDHHHDRERDVSDREHHDPGRCHGRHRGHGHDGHAYRSRQGLAERIDGLARRLEGTTSRQAPVPAPTPGPTPAPAVPAAGPVSPATASAEDGMPAQALVLVAHIEIAPWTSPFVHFQQQLLESFAKLRGAMGEPAPADAKALKDDLAAFLHRLAAGLDGDAAATDDEGSTVPGALIDLAA